MYIPERIPPKEQIIPIKKSQSPDLLNIAGTSKPYVNLAGKFLLDPQLSGKCREVANKIKSWFLSKEEVQPTVPATTMVSSTAERGLWVGGGYFLTGFASLLGVVVNVVNLVRAGQMVKNGIKLTKKKPPKHAPKQPTWEYGRSLLRKGIKETALQSAGLFGGTVGMMQSASRLAAVIQPIALPTATSVFQVGVSIAGPIAFCLSAYGARDNVRRIRTTSVQALLLSQERDRLADLKRQMGITQFQDPALKEREEIVHFALKNVKYQRINHIVNLISNSLFMVSSILAIAALATGPGAVVLGTIAAVLAAVGGTGMLLTRTILAAIRHFQNIREKKRSSVPQPSSQEMLEKAKKIMSIDQQIAYKEKKSVPGMHNGELLAFILRGSSRRLTLEEMRGAFLVGEKHYWKKAFS